MTRKNEGYLRQYQGKNSMSKRMVKDEQSQRETAEYHLRQLEKCTASEGNPSRVADYCQFEKTIDGTNQSDRVNSADKVNAQVVWEDSNQFQPFPFRLQLEH